MKRDGDKFTREEGDVEVHMPVGPARKNRGSSPMSGNEFFYKDKSGKKQDKDLHEAILEQGDHKAAAEVGKAVARRAGVSEDMITKLYGD